MIRGLLRKPSENSFSRKFLFLKIVTDNVKSDGYIIAMTTNIRISSQPPPKKTNVVYRILWQLRVLFICDSALSGERIACLLVIWRASVSKWCAWHHWFHPKRLDDVIKTFSRVTGHLGGEFIGHRWIPLTKTSDAELWCFLCSAPWINRWANNREAGDLRRHRAHYDVIVIN